MDPSLANFFRPSSQTASDIVEVTCELKSLQETIAPLVGKEPYGAANKVLEACFQNIFKTLEQLNAEANPINSGPSRT